MQILDRDQAFRFFNGMNKTYHAITEIAKIRGDSPVGQGVERACISYWDDLPPKETKGLGSYVKDDTAPFGLRKMKGDLDLICLPFMHPKAYKILYDRGQAISETLETTSQVLIARELSQYFDCPVKKMTRNMKWQCRDLGNYPAIFELFAFLDAAMYAGGIAHIQSHSSDSLEGIDRLYDGRILQADVKDLLDDFKEEIMEEIMEEVKEEIHLDAAMYAGGIAHIQSHSSDSLQGIDRLYDGRILQADVKDLLDDFKEEIMEEVKEEIQKLRQEIEEVGNKKADKEDVQKVHQELEELADKKAGKEEMRALEMAFNEKIAALQISKEPSKPSKEQAALELSKKKGIVDLPLPRSRPSKHNKSPLPPSPGKGGSYWISFSTENNVTFALGIASPVQGSQMQLRYVLKPPIGCPKMVMKPSNNIAFYPQVVVAGWSIDGDSKKLAASTVLKLDLVRTQKKCPSTLSISNRKSFFANLLSQCSG